MDKTVELDLDDAGLAMDLPRPQGPADEVQQVPYRPVQFRDDDLPTALERSAAWLRPAQQWAGGALGGGPRAGPAVAGGAARRDRDPPRLRRPRRLAVLRGQVALQRGGPRRR